jgi:hypothetical protein
MIVPLTEGCFELEGHTNYDVIRTGVSPSQQRRLSVRFSAIPDLGGLRHDTTVVDLASALLGRTAVE